MPRPGEPDAYRRQARAAGFVSRAVYKLKAIDHKYRLFRRGQRVLDLGCTPGSWLQYIGGKVGPLGLAVGVDLNSPDVAVVHPLYFVPGDVESIDFGAVTVISPYFDVVASDMAPRTTGGRQVDQQRSLELAQKALAWAEKLLRPGGHLLVKVFEGPDLGLLVSRMNQAFKICHRVNPAGTRQASPELYLLGMNKRARPGAGQRPRTP